jgi:hypothetical protein
MLSYLAHTHCSAGRGLNTRAHISPHSPRCFIFDSGTTDPALSTYILRASRLNSTVSHFFPHTRPPDMQARLAYQRPQVNTYCMFDEQTSAGSSLTQSPASIYRHAAGPALNFPALDPPASTCLTTRMTLRLLVVLSAVARAALQTQ